jgi:hypothetical protein
VNIPVIGPPSSYDSGIIVVAIMAITPCLHQQRLPFLPLQILKHD